MKFPARKTAFILASTDQGTLIVNRFDFRRLDEQRAYGVGHQLLERSVYEPEEVELATSLLEVRRKVHGPGVVAIDGGANIGVHTVEWAKTMTGWGSVLAMEAQERIFYALAGNITLNNCLNARAMHAALGARVGTLRIPTPDYLQPGSFGSLELQHSATTEFIGQPIDYSPTSLTDVSMVSLDSLQLPRVDLLKLDVEGMELEVLQGACGVLTRHRPYLLVEAIKSEPGKLFDLLQSHDYELLDCGMNLLGIHTTDPALPQLKTLLRAATRPQP